MSKICVCDVLILFLKYLMIGKKKLSVNDSSSLSPSSQRSSGVEAGREARFVQTNTSTKKENKLRDQKAIERK